MTQYEWLLVDFLNFIYNFIWLVFLARRHYGQVTTTAGHIFELNVLLNVSISNFLLILIVDLELLPKGTISEIFDTASTYSFSVAMAGSLIETVVFLKTLNAECEHHDDKHGGKNHFGNDNILLCVGSH